MRQKIILLSGFGGTGKTTVGNLLYDYLDNVALIEADELFHIKPFEIGEKMGRIKLRNTLDIMANFLEEEYHYIICIGLVWSQAELDAVTDKFSSYDHFLFWLSANKETRFKRVIDRAEPGDTLSWLEKVEQTIIDPWPLNMRIGKTVKIDTSTKSSIEIMHEIIKYID